MNTKVYEKVALDPEVFAKAEKLAAKHGAGIRDFIPQVVAEKVEEMKDADNGKIITSYTFDSSLYWDLCELAGGREGVATFLSKLIEEAIAEKWKGEQ